MKIITAIIFGLGVGILLTGCGQPGPPGERPVTATEPARDEHPGTVHGTVTRPDGTPVADAMVTATPLDQYSWPVPDIAIVTDTNGRYTWPLRTGHYRLEVTIDDSMGHTDVTVAEQVSVEANITVND